MTFKEAQENYPLGLIIGNFVEYSTPVEIAYRDWAIITIDILINKVINALSSKVKSED